MRVIDISRPLSAHEAVYPGNPKPKLTWVRTFHRDGSALATLTLGLHTATHLDAPLHYVKNGKTVDRVDLERCFGWTRVIEVKTDEIDEKEVRRIKPKVGEIILWKTKNSRPNRLGSRGGRARKNSKKFDPHFAHLVESGARALVKANVKAIGIDGPSIRKFHLLPDMVHPMILRAGIPIYEGLNLRDAVPGRYYFFGLPLKIIGAEASPVRAILIKS